MECTICLDAVTQNLKRQRRVSVKMDCCGGRVHKSCAADWNNTCLASPRCPRCNTGLPNDRIRRMNTVLRKWMAETFYYGNEKVKKNSYAVLGIQFRIHDTVTGLSGVQEMTDKEWVLSLQLAGRTLVLVYPPLHMIPKPPTPNLSRILQEEDESKYTRIYYTLLN